jgi:hypothetical protein
MESINYNRRGRDMSSMNIEMKDVAKIVRIIVFGIVEKLTREYNSPEKITAQK